MKTSIRPRRRALLSGAAAPVLALSLLASPAAAAQDEARTFVIASQPLADALLEFSGQADVDIVASAELTRGRTAPQVNGEMTTGEALNRLLAGSGLTATPSGAGYILRAAQDPQGGSAGDVEALIVTAQKKEENIQDVPIAISAFSQRALEEQKIEGGFDLLKAIPNVTFSKTNFSSYNFSIRGIGTKAISATTDPGVAVSFNNVSLIQNRLFEQEYFDVERVEVLRGPQGTLYGRNATAGVINVISAKPKLNEFDGWLKGEVGNYDTKRVSAMVNVPIIEGVLAVRFAGALTDRQGYDFNEGTGNAVNGRELWSGRLSVGFEPTDRIRADLIWERFEEDDNRSRTGKQVCYRDPGLTSVGTFDISDLRFGDEWFMLGMTSGGCKPGSMYDKGAFDTPNGLAMPFVFSAILLQNGFYPLGYDNGVITGIIDRVDPYGGLRQSEDLRVIDSIVDPVYRAHADVVELNVDFELSDGLTLFSQTAWNKDSVYSFQDYNRFNTQPIFNNTAGLTRFSNPSSGLSYYQDIAPGGVFCDPQLGCTNKMVTFDISSAAGEQFTQEIRLQSSFGGPVNFSLGANYTEFDVLADYYVFNNILTALSISNPFKANPFNVADYAHNYGICAVTDALGSPANPPLSIDDPDAGCVYVDPNPIESINGEGHNYYRSKNPYKLKSTAIFGEMYWEVSDALKVTAGLRYTDDRKTFTPVPTQVLLSRQPITGGGFVNRGYPADPDIKQKWGEWTGRFGVDWKPDLSFTDQSLLYAFYSHGYKGGGANPPTPGYATQAQLAEQFPTAPDPSILGLKLLGVNYGPTFEAEFVDAFEVGSKNTLLQGALVANFTGFYYDYKDYQVSRIVDRTAINDNFDATVWGLELETVFSPTRDLRFLWNLGYLDTKIARGEKSIDVMNRTQGDPDYILIKPWLQLPSNCIVPVTVVQDFLTTYAPLGLAVATAPFANLCGRVPGGFPPFDANLGGPYDPFNYPINGGAGIYQELGGNELPNSPHWTTNLGGQYTMHFDGGWDAVVRADAYWQGQSWARVYNAVNDKLHGWYNANLSLRIENPDIGLEIELYAKNILDKTPITDAFINSDDTGLTTNVFVLDPRLIGMSIRKAF